MEGGGWRLLSLAWRLADPRGRCRSAEGVFTTSAGLGAAYTRSLSENTWGLGWDRILGRENMARCGIVWSPTVCPGTKVSEVTQLLIIHAHIDIFICLDYHL